MEKTMQNNGFRAQLRKRKKQIWFALNMLCSVVYLLWRIFFTIPFGYGFVSIAAGVTLLVVEALGLLESLIHYRNMSSVQNYALPNVPLERYPHVDVFIATYSEEPKLLYKTINGCKHMRYPDKNKVHIYLCDDNRRPKMRALAERMGINYLDRPDNEGAKAGNLNHALAHSSSPYVVTFDADMIPKSDFLLKMAPYFVDAEMKNEGKEEKDKKKLGFVQSPQCFYNPDLFQFNLFSESRIPNEQDYFYRDIQVARTRSNSVIYGGSNTMLSREALEDAGGFYTEAITEDFATGILIQKKGYFSIGTREPLASGLSATDLQSLIQQRTRWARGVIATGRKMHIFLSRNLSFAQKMNYWASVWYWYAPIKRLVYIMSPILYATFGFMVFKCTIWQILAFWLPMYVTSNISLKMLSNNIRTTKWTSIYETVLFPYLLVPVLLESFGIKLKKFKVTAKEEQKNQKGKNVIYTIPFFILIVLSVIGIANCIWIMFDTSSMGPVVVLFWLVYNLFLLVMSLFFVDGRVPYRKAERVAVQMECEVHTQNGVYHAVTRDISEKGISFLIKSPVYIPAEEKVQLQLKNELYKAELLAKLVYVSQRDDMWNYSMQIVDYKESYDAYLQMLYDRIPILPQEIKKDSGSFEDLWLNMKKRVTVPNYQKRQYPRILLETDVEGQSIEDNMEERVCRMVHLRDFNYCYVTLLRDGEVQKGLELTLTDGVVLSCCYETALRNGNLLYAVKNLDELTGGTATEIKLLHWLEENAKNPMKPEKNGKNTAKKNSSVEKKTFDEKDLL